MPQIFVLHENPEWLIPFSDAFNNRGEVFENWNLKSRSIDLSSLPPEGVFYNRMSASSHTRGNRFSPEITSVVLGWLEDNGRRVINSNRALHLELSKSAQISALKASGVPVPHTIAVTSSLEILDAAKILAPKPIIIKPNRGGKGLGVRLFTDHSILQEQVLENALDKSVDGITLVQEYIAPVSGNITRAEFLASEFHYAVQVNASNGFELCPADTCAINNEDQQLKFNIIPDISKKLKDKIKLFLNKNGIEIAGVEFTTDENGNDFVYDVNTNTNYNKPAEMIAGKNAPQALVDFLINERNQIYS